MMNEAQQQAHPAEVACEFLKRTNLQGGEVEAYAQTFNWLQSILTGQLTVITTKEFTNLNAELAELRAVPDDEEPPAPPPDRVIKESDIPVLQTEEEPTAELEGLDLVL